MTIISEDGEDLTYLYGKESKCNICGVITDDLIVYKDWVYGGPDGDEMLVGDPQCKKCRGEY